MAITKKFDHKKVEEGLYQYWRNNGFFNALNFKKKPYVTVIPPPNITGKLHLGHAMDNTLQDIIIRRKRMQGFDALYLPGMDHAGIATQARVEEMLKKEGVSKYELGRAAFLEKVWDWKSYYAEEIRKQWESLGISLDYRFEAFTLDDNLNEAVNNVFIKLYEKGLIYRDYKIIHWDVEAKTALSNIEVNYQEEDGFLYYLRYPLVDEDDYLVIATTRPETMFADQALMINPQDEKRLKYLTKKVFIPGTKTIIPIIADDYVDLEFGTGIVKVTPAHDLNDFEVGQRHNLAVPLCMDEKGYMTALAGKYEGLERFQCREQVIKDLKRLNLVEKIENYRHSIGRSERTNVIVEPRLSLQWFVKMKPLAARALKENEAKFYPERFLKVYQNWLENIEDWCISRQLWWGHQIPVWYKGDEIKVQKESPGLGWRQDEDVLDTWFSSALWPFSTLGWLDNKEIFERYYPTDVLVTGYDIIFFWVARMIFQGLEFTNKTPFKDVLIHGLIRDEKGRKMSKSLNNGIDPMDIIEKYGIDALRYFLSTNSTPGQDMRFEIEKVEAAWNFINKLWNMARFVELNVEKPLALSEVELTIYDEDLLMRLDEVIKEANFFYDKYDFGEASRVIYNFTWNYFAANYIEYAKYNLKTNPEATMATLHHTLIVILKLLHPLMPFVTERLFQSLTKKASIMIESWPNELKIINKDAYDTITMLNDIIKQIRHFKQENNVTKELTIYLKTSNKLIKQQEKILTAFLKTEKLFFDSDENETFLLTGKDYNIYIKKADVINKEEEKIALKETLNKLKAELKRSENLLNNENFLTKANPKKVALEKEKQASYLKQYQDIKDKLTKL
ncbi:MAG: valine--tRNA ligase [Acholeplasmataceae bacterium]|nr:valine--tRNA ligase [Acholeplasmataceae bacterium]